MTDTFHNQAFAPTRERHKERKKAIEQVSQVIREKYGERFSVKDVSLWTYSQDVHDAPLELMISVRIIVALLSSFPNNDPRTTTHQMVLSQPRRSFRKFTTQSEIA